MANMANELSPFLTSDNVKEESIIAPIENVEKQEVGTDKKWVLFLRGHDKGLVLNATNTRKLIELFGDESDNWIGKRIELFFTEANFKGKAVGAVRIRLPQED